MISFLDVSNAQDTNVIIAKDMYPAVLLIRAIANALTLHYTIMLPLFHISVPHKMYRHFTTHH